MIPMSILASLSSATFSPKDLWNTWPKVRFVTTPAPSLRHKELLQYHSKLACRYPEGIQLKDIGSSFQGRTIQLLKLGAGNRKILLWSQMHGDEPSATPALLDMADYLLANGDHPVVRSILENYTLLMIPMLNPDGAEIYERVNAQGIDMNRDALQLATPEGRLLKQVRDVYEPMLGFNLHNQDRMTTVGNTGSLATNSVLAVSGDAENTLTRGRLRAKRACVAIVEALEPLMPGGVARYYEDWSPLAFGDNITAWGTPVVLIESGGLPDGYEVTELTRLNFVAILSVLVGLAENDLAGFDPQVYEDLPGNESDAWSDIVVRGGRIMQPGSTEFFRSDLAFNYLQSGRQAVEADRKTRIPSQIFMLGDASCHGAGRSVNANGMILLAAFEVGVEGWSKDHWLDENNLIQLAQKGVGTVYWSVDAADHVAAQSCADKLAIRGLPQIRVQTNPAAFPGVVLSGPLNQAASASLGAALESLGIGESQGNKAINTLWMQPPGKGRRSTHLCKDRAASFLMISAVGNDQIDFTSSRLVSVWLDGYQVV